MAELSSVDYAFLAVLRTVGREINNTEMDNMYEVRLVGRSFERLVGAGYISSDTKHRPYRHVITQDGLKALSSDLEVGDDHVEEGEKRSAREKILWAGLVASQQTPLSLRPGDAGAERSADALAAVEENIDLETRIRAAYAHLTAGPGEWVKLVSLRPLLADVPKGALDAALVGMLRAGNVRLEPDPLEHRLTAAERKAALDVGGESCHMLAVGRP